MSSGVFRGKESLNRTKLSRLVQDLLNFGVLGSLWLWGVGGGWMGCRGWGVGGWGCRDGGVGMGWMEGGVGGVGAPTHVHTTAHAHMYRNCKWLLTWRHPCLSCLSCLCMCVHVCTCVCVHACMGHSPTHPYPPPTYIHPSVTPRGGLPESVKIQ